MTIRHGDAAPLSPGEGAWDGAWAKLASLSTVVAAHLPTALMVYALIVWPIAFGDSEVGLSEQALGWLAAPAGKDESSLKLLAYPSLFVVSAACLLTSGAYREVPWLSPLCLTLAAFAGLAILSSTWSLFPPDSFMRGILCALIIATLLFATFSARDYITIAKGLFWTFFAITLMNVLAIFLKPPSPIGYTGIYPHKNFFGYVSALILYFALHAFTFESRVYKLAAVPMLILAPVFLLASQSKTSVGLAGLAPLIGVAMVVLRRWIGISPALVVMLPAILLPFSFWIGRAAGLWDFQLINEKLLGSATLTGRTDIWNVANLLIAERPLLGWGYEAVWDKGPEGIVTKNAVGFVRIMPTAHNGYIDVFVQLGGIGLLLLLAIVTLVLIGVGRVIDVNARLGWLIASLSAFILLHNLLESDILISSNQLSMMFILFSFISLRVVRNNDETT